MGAAAVMPHSLQLETPANLVVMENTAGTQMVVATHLSANS
jgi:hypothetical protein